MSKDPQQIGWSEKDDIELSDEALAHEDLVDENCVGCCETNFHVISSPDDFQKLLAGLQTEGKFQ